MTADNVKNVFADALLELCEHKELAKITVKDLEEKAGFSRATFYNHFLDKNDLVHYTYDAKLFPEWNYDPVREDKLIESREGYKGCLYEWHLENLRLIKKHRRFMKMAFELNGQNNLFDHMVSVNCRVEVEDHEIMRGKPLTKRMKEVTQYHGAAFIYMLREWVLADMPISEEELADKIVISRFMSLLEVLEIHDEDNIYIKTYKAITK